VPWLLQVVRNSQSSLLIRALAVVMTRGLHACGETSCTQLAYSMALRIGWQSAAVICLCLIAAPNLLLVVLQIFCQRRMADSLERSLDAGWKNQKHWAQQHEEDGEDSMHGGHGARAWAVGDTCSSLSASRNSGQCWWKGQAAPRREKEHTPVMRYRKNLFFRSAVKIPTLGSGSAYDGWGHCLHPALPPAANEEEGGVDGNQGGWGLELHED
jgi:hypothetical protein